MTIGWSPLGSITTGGGNLVAGPPSPIDGTPTVLEVPNYTLEAGSMLIYLGIKQFTDPDQFMRSLPPQLSSLLTMGDPSLKVRHVDDTNFDGVADGYYDVDSGELRIPKSMAEAIRARTEGTGVGESFGAALANACDPRCGGGSGTRVADDHALATSLALVVHEQVHAKQDQDGTIDRVLERSRAMLAAGDERGAVELFARELELPAQQIQERLQLAMGAVPRTSAWMTLDSVGRPRTDADALAAIVSSRYDDLLASLRGEDEVPGRRLPGRRLPGRRLPGAVLD